MSADVRLDLHIRAAELLDHGEWVPREPLMRELMRLVPFPVAMRVAEQQRVAHWRRVNPGHPRDEPVPPRQRPRPADKIARTGRRSLVRELLHQDCYEHDVKNGAPRIRLVWIPRGVKMHRRRRTPVTAEAQSRTIQHRMAT